MLKTIARMLMLMSLIFLAACAGDVKPNQEPSTGANTPTQSPAINTQKPQITEPKQPNETSFKAELLINLKSYADQLTENDLPALEVLEKNLTALVEHDHTIYQSGFVNKKLAEAMEPYYDEQYQYKFTDIESIDSMLPNEHQVNITVIGQRLDIAEETVENVKMLYAIRPNDQGKWVIYIID
ncbi:hypothetical protein MHH60_16485 [Paenibacillus sp. FSL H7-0716]|uniref:DUF4440 domain-containing protein n=2 Tax=Paenibacillus odorifer TaxID=189426 RepID=A0AAD0KLT0_9BACL|nr:hypothetical protein [Paenibacillus odorifer]AWV35574.1 hypothetical protein CD191_24695 [Paenibacillus odorifer]OME13155.1 hypothetical protein BSK47_25735 [Paenibacillus odorifer]OME27777.1 hypothetical protein BSK57_03955 [Paenibacillus odorifer]